MFELLFYDAVVKTAHSGLRRCAFTSSQKFTLVHEICKMYDFGPLEGCPIVRMTLPGG